MGDPLSVAASIIACIQATAEVVKYISAVEHSVEESDRCMIQLTTAIGRLVQLRERVDQSNAYDPWFESVRKLADQGGVLDTYQATVASLKKRMKKKPGQKLSLTKLKWPFKKTDIEGILSSVEDLNRVVDRALADDLRSLTEEIYEVSKRIEERLAFLETKQILQNDEDTRAILDWLSPLEFNSTHDSVYRKREEGTGLWVLETKEYQLWQNNDSHLLWCQGIPGAGKTTIASLIIQNLLDNPPQPTSIVLYIYLSYKDKARQTFNHLIGALLKQLIAVTGEAPSAVQELYRKGSAADLSIPLLEILDSYPEAHIVIDALDECVDDEKDNTQTKLQDLIPQLLTKAKVLITSRHSPPPLTQYTNALELNLAAKGDDMRRYILGRMGPKSRLAKLLKTDPQLKDDIIDAVLESTRGMFLLAQMHMDSLSTQWSARNVRNNLRILPNTLARAYDETMQRMKDQGEEDYELALRVFSWVSLANRPLSFEELQHALAVEPGTTELEPTALPLEDLIMSLCSDLLTIENGVVRLVHQTFQEYLRENFERLLPGAQEKLAVACLTYLQFDCFASPWGVNLPEWNRHRTEHKLLDYAAVHWGHHLNKAREPEEARRLAVSLMQDNRKCANASHFLTLSDNIFVAAPQGPTRGFGILHILAHFSLDLTMSDLLSVDSIDIDPCDEWKLTPLITVARPGRVAVAKVLLDHGANINAEDSFGRTAISFAAEHGSTNMVDFLLSRNVDANHHGGFERRTPLIWAATNGHTEIVRLLLRKDHIRLNIRDMDGFTALNRACCNGHEDVVKLLLARNVDHNIKDALGHSKRSPFAWAATGGYISIMNILASHGTPIDPRSPTGMTPVLYAASRDNIKVLRALKDLGTDMNVVDNLGKDALIWAAHRNSSAVVPYLVETLKFDINYRDKALRTALFWACWHGSPDAAGYLLGHGADPNAVNDLSETPLVVAAKVGRPGAVARLLQHPGIEIDYRDSNLRTSLSYALQFGRQEVAKKLLKAGANVNIQGQRGRSCLSIAAQWSRFEIFEMVLQAKEAGPGLVDNEGQSPLAHALAELRYKEWLKGEEAERSDRAKIIEVLREKGETVEEEIVERIFEKRKGNK